MALTKVSSKYQIVIPKSIRQKLTITPGMNIHIEVIDEKRAVIHSKNLSIVDALSGLGKEVWRSLGGADAYIKRERAAWKK